MLAGALVHPRSHLINRCTCWSKFIVETLANCRCQALVGDRKKGPEEILAGFDGFIHEFNSCECVDPVGGGFGPPPASLE